MAAAVAELAEERGGFDFQNCRRNAFLEKQGYKAPSPTKTGTTIVGLVFKDGVCLGADTRATGGNMVADKNCEKIHYIAKNIYCCGAGTSADTEFTTALISSKLELQRLNNGTQPRVATAKTRLCHYLFGYQGYVSAALVLGGVDVTGPSLYSVWPHGSSDKLPYCTMGSGSLAAMAVFEQKYHDDMTEEEAKSLVQEAVESGIFNDEGSGSNVDLVVITKAGAKPFRNFAKPNERLFRRAKPYNFPIGSTEWLSEKREMFQGLVVTVQKEEKKSEEKKEEKKEEKMDLS